VRWGRLRPSVLRVLGIPFLAQPARLSIGYSPEIFLHSVGKCRNITSLLVHGIVSAIVRFSTIQQPQKCNSHRAPTVERKTHRSNAALGPSQQSQLQPGPGVAASTPWRVPVPEVALRVYRGDELALRLFHPYGGRVRRYVPRAGGRRYCESSARYRNRR